MLLLMFRTGVSLYAFDARHVVEVVPRVDLRQVPHAPAYLAGLLSYRGLAVPVVDFGILVGGPPASESLSTRIIVTEFTRYRGTNHLVGVVAGNVSHVTDAGPGSLVSPAMGLDEAPYLSTLLRVDEGMVQLVKSDMLLSDRMQDALYGTTADDR